MNKQKLKVAIVGTNGIPAQYGGFETLAENLTKELSSDFDFIVYCSNKQKNRLKTHNNARLININLKANGWQSIIFDTYSLFHASLTSDVILYLGPAAGFILPIIKLLGKKIIVNYGGLNEWEREKYNTFEKFICRVGYSAAARFADFTIADNRQLRESIKNSFSADSVVIRYGGDHATTQEIDTESLRKYPFLSHDYFVNLSRAQVDNNLHLILNAFETTPDKTLVMISNWDVSTYGAELRKKYLNQFDNIILLDAIYEQKTLDIIRSNATAYIHSHSYCGTAPSLVEAMSLGLPIISFDVPTNRETTQHKAFFFKNVEELRQLLMNLTKEKLATNKNEMKQIAASEYIWSNIAKKYSNSFKGQ